MDAAFRGITQTHASPLKRCVAHSSSPGVLLLTPLICPAGLNLSPCCARSAARGGVASRLGLGLRGGGICCNPAPRCRPAQQIGRIKPRGCDPSWHRDAAAPRTPQMGLWALPNGGWSGPGESYKYLCGFLIIKHEY